MKNYFVLLFAAAMLVFAGCNDDETSSTISKKHNFFDFQKGNYYVFDYNEIDSAEKVKSGTEKIDSLLITEASNAEGRTTYKSELYSAGKKLKDIEFYVENYDLYLKGMPYDADLESFDNWYIIYGNRFEKQPWNYGTLYSEETYKDTTYKSTSNLNCYFDKLTKIVNGTDSSSIISYKVIRDKSTGVYSNGNLVYTKVLKRIIYFTFIENGGIFEIKESPYTISYLYSGSATKTTKMSGYNMKIIRKGKI